MTTVALSEPRKSGHLLRNIGFAALPAVILLWSLADLTLGRELAEWILADNLPVRMQLQLHKLLWNDARGH